MNLPPQSIQAVLWGMAVNAMLGLVKLAAGILGHSYALIADAAESLADILSSVVVLSGLHLADKPADQEHPYGHGRAETLAAAAVSVILLGVAAGVAWQAMITLGAPRLSPHPFTLVVLALVIGAKEWLFRRLHAVGEETSSPAMRVEAWHQRSDAITSVAAALGILCAWLGGPSWVIADNIAALVASALIAFNGFRLLWTTAHDLMDGSPDASIVEKIRGVILTGEGVRGIDKLMVRTIGAKLIVDLHLEVASEISVREGHRLAHLVKQQLRQQIPRISEVLVHVEPYDEPTPPRSS